MTTPFASLSICAILMVRSEAPYLRYLLPRLASEQIEVAVIDHDSTDETPDILREYRGMPVVSIASLPYHGYFSLSQQLEAKRTLMEGLSHDWLVHLDADEILEHREPGKTLRQAIEDAQELHCNAINFEEFTFIPEPGADYFGRDFVMTMRRYYFFQIRKNWLHRAWRKDAGLDNVAAAGHVLQGQGIRLSPYTHVLRHYIGLNQEHIWQKYLQRVFDPSEIARGWHRDRKQLTREQLLLPKTAVYLQRLDEQTGTALYLGSPAPSHFWHWSPEELGTRQ